MAHPVWFNVRDNIFIQLSIFVPSFLYFRKFIIIIIFICSNLHKAITTCSCSWKQHWIEDLVTRFCYSKSWITKTIISFCLYQTTATRHLFAATLNVKLYARIHQYTAYKTSLTDTIITNNSKLTTMVNNTWTSVQRTCQNDMSKMK